MVTLEKKTEFNAYLTFSHYSKLTFQQRIELEWFVKVLTCMYRVGNQILTLNIELSAGPIFSNLGFFLLKPNYFNQISLWYSIILFLQCYILYFKCHGHFFQGHPEPNPNTFSGIIFETTKKTTIISLLIRWSVTLNFMNLQLTWRRFKFWSTSIGYCEEGLMVFNV